MTRSVHFIGIAGSGMKPLAELCKHRGYHVTGSDQKLSFTDKFQVQKADLVVYSSAIPKTNEDLIAAKKYNKKILHRSEFLAQLSSEQKSISVAGTHGKTSTAMMIAHICNQQKHPVDHVIGGIANNLIPQPQKEKQ